MALPTTGQLSLKDIGVELGITAGNQASMRSMASDAGKTIPDSVSEFYGYSAGDDITASWSNLGTPTTTSTSFQQWRWLSLSGLSGATVKAYITLNVTSINLGSVSVYWYHDTNSSPPSGTTAGTSVGSRSSVGSSSFYVPTSTYTSSSNYLMIKQYISKSASGNANGNITLTTTYQVGTGTVNSYTTSGTTAWSFNF